MQELAVGSEPAAIDGGLMQVAVCCFQWNNGFRQYRPEYVNILAGLYRRFLSIPHRFVCVTDETEGFAAHVDVMPLPDEARAAAEMISPEGVRFPASYRRLWAFSDGARCLGDIVLMTDIDCIVTGAVDPLFDFFHEKQADFVGWRPSTTWGVDLPRFGGGTWLLRTGSRTDVWKNFNARNAARARAKGFRGSDQAWISYCLAATDPSWPRDSGIYQAQQMKREGFRVLPPDARIVHFNGRLKPWEIIGVPWITEHWSEARGPD